MVKNNPLRGSNSTLSLRQAEHRSAASTSTAMYPTSNSTSANARPFIPLELYEPEYSTGVTENYTKISAHHSPLPANGAVNVSQHDPRYSLNMQSGGPSAGQPSTGSPHHPHGSRDNTPPLVKAWWQLRPEEQQAYMDAPPGVDVEEVLGERNYKDQKRMSNLPLRPAEHRPDSAEARQSESSSAASEDRLSSHFYVPNQPIPRQGNEVPKEHTAQAEVLRAQDEQKRVMANNKVEQHSIMPQPGVGYKEPVKDYKRQIAQLEAMKKKRSQIAHSMRNQTSAGKQDYQSQLMLSEQQGRKTCMAQSAQVSAQDYQMQLMLLEQQNKKRLMMARLEGDELNRMTDKQQKQNRGSSIGDRFFDEHPLKDPAAYTKPFCDFLTQNPTIWHAVGYFEKKLLDTGFKMLSPRSVWNDELKTGGKYYTTRNGTALIAFTVGDDYKSGNGVAMIAGHIDALTARLKPISTKKSAAGFAQLGIAPWSGGLNGTWWDRDLGIAGRVLVKDSKSGKITSKHVKLGWPIAKVPTLAPHFGIGMMGQNNPETEMVPIIGLDNGKGSAEPLGGEGTFTATQPPKLVQTIANELSIQDYSTIINWELELYNFEPARTIGLDHEIISAGRIDDKLCSWSAMEALLSSSSSTSGGIVKLVALFDDEELGSEARQGAKGNFLPATIARIAEAFTDGPSANALGATYASSFLLSADVVHAGHPNFLGAYEQNHIPRLNEGLVIHANFQGHTTTDSVSTAVLQQIVEKTGQNLQFFMVRNGMRSGGTIGPMLSTAMGCRAVDVGAPMLGMHSIRATTGSLDPGIGVKIYKAFLDEFESVDAEFAQ